MKKLLFSLFILFLFCSCVTNYYYVNLEEDTTVYKKSDDNADVLVVLGKGQRVYIAESSKKFRKIKWDSYSGWVTSPSYNYVSSSNYETPKRTASSRSNFATKSLSGTEVKVKGYYRKNGTYVRPHTRSAPKSRR